MLLDTLYLLHLFSKQDVDERTRYEIYGRAWSFGASAMKVWANLIESAEWPDEAADVAPRGFIGSRMFFRGVSRRISRRVAVCICRTVSECGNIGRQ
jgi:hypothetical protein